MSMCSVGVKQYNYVATFAVTNQYSMTNESFSYIE